MNPLKRYVRIEGYENWLLYLDGETLLPRYIDKARKVNYKEQIKLHKVILVKYENGFILGEGIKILDEKYGIHYPNSGAFKNGLVPFNKGKQLNEYLTKEQIEKIKQTQLVAGVHTMEKSLSWKGGVQFNKYDCVLIQIATNERIRRPKFIYESHYGKMQKGFVIVHKNRNKDDDEIENLLAISRSDLMKLNSNTHPMTMDDLIEKYNVESVNL